MTRSKGQSLTEYAFAGALIAVVCIGVLALAGGSLLNFGETYSKEVYKATGDKISFFGADTSSLGAKGKGLGGVVPPPKKGEEQVCFSNGYCVNLPSKLTSNTEVVGNNGQYTLAFSKVLKQLADQLKHDPNADPYLKQLISKLAKQGHALGSAEQIVDKNGKVKKALKKDDTVTVYDPNSKKDVKQAKADKKDGINTIASASLENALDDISKKGQAFDKTYSEFLNYMDKNPNAWPPELNKVVNLQGDEIVNIWGNYTSGQEDIGDSGTSFVDDYYEGGDITHQDSNTICETGGSGCIQ